MPIYCMDSLREKLSPELLKCLKGKACFHITTPDPQMMAHIKGAMKLGYERYKKLGWV